MKYLLIALFVLFTGCADPKTIQGTTYDTYGVFNESDKKNPNIQYELSLGNVIWGIVLSSTIIAPIYFFGFSLYEPTATKASNNIKGAL